jgi:predicted ferric reductase
MTLVPLLALICAIATVPVALAQRRIVGTGTATITRSNDEVLPPFIVRPFEGVYFTWNIFTDDDGNKFLSGQWNYTTNSWVGIGIKSDKRMLGPLIICYLNSTSTTTFANCDDYVADSSGYNAIMAPVQLSYATAAGVSRTPSGGTIAQITFLRLIQLSNESDSQCDLDLLDFHRVIFANGKWDSVLDLPKQHQIDDSMQTTINFVTGEVKAVESDTWKLAIGAIGGTYGGIAILVRIVRCLEFRIPPIMRIVVAVMACLLVVASVLGYGFARYYDYKKTYKGKPLPRCAGDMAALCFAMLLLPVGKRILFSDLLGVSHERAVNYHMFMACLMVLAILCHCIGMAYYYDTTFILRWRDKDEVSRLPGVIAFSILLLMIPLAFLRNMVSYRLFRISHYLYFLVSFFAVCHYPPLALMLIPGLTLLILCFLHKRLAAPVDETENLHALTYDAKAGVIIMDVIKDDLVAPGQYYFIGIPQISFLEQHPFSVARCQTADEVRTIRFVIKPTANPSGWTKKLADIASSGVLPKSYKLDGPHGVVQVTPGPYNHLVMISGGVGLNPMIHFLNECAEAPDELCIEEKESITFIWVCRTHALVEVYLEDLIRSTKELMKDNPKLKLSIRIYVKSPDNEMESLRDPLPAEIKITTGSRPNWLAEAQHIASMVGPSPVATYISGPPGLAKEAAAALKQTPAAFHIHEEQFYI